MTNFIFILQVYACSIDMMFGSNIRWCHWTMDGNGVYSTRAVCDAAGKARLDTTTVYGDTMVGAEAHFPVIERYSCEQWPVQSKPDVPETSRIPMVVPQGYPSPAYPGEVGVTHGGADIGTRPAK